ncbi:MAG: PQQ-binding-like beta-propeller repeat protein [Planctomycetota bacterium]
MIPLSILPRFLLIAALTAMFSTPAVSEKIDDRIPVDASDWPWWRGPARNGEANPDQDPPTEWSESKNVIWKSLVPGRGDSSPTIVGPRIFLATADEQADTQSVLCYDRQTGKQLWQTVVHRGGMMRKNQKSTGASGTVACDGANLYVNFANKGAVFVTALGIDGKQLWQTKIADYQIHQGYGASPTVYQSLVLAAADSHAGGAIVALDRNTGKIAWKRDRPHVPNYTSPIVLRIAGRDQLIFTGCDQILSLDPLTGKTLWEVDGSTTECVTSTVTDGKHVFSSGGYPKNHLAAIRADGSAKIVWETKDRVYVPSLLEKDGYLFGVLDAGVAACWNCATGQVQWKKRLGGEFSSSPVLVNGVIYATSENGETFVFRANPKEFQGIAENKLGDQTMATPTICGGRVYLRVVEQQDGKRQEMLYCLGKK